MKLGGQIETEIVHDQQLSCEVLVAPLEIRVDCDLVIARLWARKDRTAIGESLLKQQSEASTVVYGQCILHKRSAYQAIEREKAHLPALVDEDPAQIGGDVRYPGPGPIKKG